VFEINRWFLVPALSFQATLCCVNLAIKSNFIYFYDLYSLDLNRILVIDFGLL